MDFNALVDEIARKVQDKLREQGAASPVNTQCNAALFDKPCIMVLSRGESERDRCRCLMENGAVSEHYDLDFVLPSEPERDIARYRAIILFDLDCDTLSKIAAGTADTGYTAIASKAILMGKKVLVPKEEIELFKYRDTAAASYYEMMLGKLNFLAEAGVIFCDFDKLGSELIAPKSSAARDVSGLSNTVVSPGGGQLELDKRVVTEGDIRAASTAGAVCVAVRQGAIITVLATDYAKGCGISIVIK